MALDFDESHGPGILGFVGWLFAALAFAACAVLAAVLAPRPLASAARRAEESPGRSFVYGLVSLPAFFVLCVVLAVTIVGIPLLLLLVPAYLALVFFGALVAAFFIGTRVLMVTGRYRVGNALAAVVGALILAATTFIPVLGDLLLYALSLLGTGAVILALFSRRRPRASHPSYEAYVRDRAGGLRAPCRALVSTLGTLLSAIQLVGFERCSGVKAKIKVSLGSPSVPTSLLRSLPSSRSRHARRPSRWDGCGSRTGSRRVWPRGPRRRRP